jgi:hypothetical protein
MQHRQSDWLASSAESGTRHTERPARSQWSLTLTSVTRAAFGTITRALEDFPVGDTTAARALRRLIVDAAILSIASGECGGRGVVLERACVKAWGWGARGWWCRVMAGWHGVPAFIARKHPPLRSHTPSRHTPATQTFDCRQPAMVSFKACGWQAILAHVTQKPSPHEWLVATQRAGYNGLVTARH